MSFSSQIKEKLCKSEYGCMNCAAYELSGALKTFKLFNEPGNSSASIYAYLRRMEEEGLILSEWTIEGKQKPKRVYSLTELGRSKIGELVASVAECAGALFELVEIYRKQVLSAD